MPSGREAAAGIDTALGNVGLSGLLSVSPNYEENLARRNSVAQQAPVGSAIGDVLADATTIATGRAPLMQNKTGGFFDEGIETGMEKISAMLAKKAKPKTGLARFSKDFVDNETTRKIARGLGRGAETGIEGMVLSVLKGGDPVEAALMSGGAQLASSAIQTTTGELFEYPDEIVQRDSSGKPMQPKTIVKKLPALAFNAAIFGGLYQILNVAIPGGVDSVIQSEEAGYDKAMAMLALGVISHAAGGRTSEESTLAAFPVVADFLTSIPRSAVTGFFADMSKPDAGGYQKVLDRIQQAPDAFSEDQRERLLEGLRSGSFGATVDELLEDESFSNILNAPDPRLSEVPVND